MNIILIGSQKNHIGKTVISIKMALELSRRGKKVLLIDLSSGKVKMSEYLNVDEVIIYDVVDVLNKTCSIDQAIIENKENENLYLLPSPQVSGKIEKIKKESLVNLLESLEYDYLVIDADKFIHSYLDFSKIHNVISVNNNDFSCIKEINSDKTLSSKADNFILVINKYNKNKAKQGIMIEHKDIERLTGTRVSALIEESPQGGNDSSAILSDSDFLKVGISNIIKNLHKSGNPADSV